MSRFKGLKLRKFTPPDEGEPIRRYEKGLEVPENPVVPFIEGDGVGPEITKAIQGVINETVAVAYGGEKWLVWWEIFAGEKAFTHGVSGSLRIPSMPFVFSKSPSKDT